MGFDVGKAMRGLDTSRPSLASSRAFGMDTAWQEFAKQQAQQRRDLFRNLSGIGQMESSVYGKLARNIASLNPPGLATNKWSAIGAIGSYKADLVSDLLKSSLINPRTPPPGLAKLNHSLTSVAFKAIDLKPMIDMKPLLASLAQPRIDMRPWLDGVVGNVGLANSVAGAFRFHGLYETHGATWNLRRVLLGNNPALRSILKNATIFGPIVVPPDYEGDTPFDYHPDLPGWLIPGTDTESEEDFDIEECWAEVVAFAQGIAGHHRTEVLLSVMSGDRRFVIRVVKHPAVAVTVAGAVGGAAGGAVSGEIVVGGVSSGVGALVTYLLTRR